MLEFSPAVPPPKGQLCSQIWMNFQTAFDHPALVSENYDALFQEIKTSATKIFLGSKPARRAPRHLLMMIF